MHKPIDPSLLSFHQSPSQTKDLPVFRTGENGILTTYKEIMPLRLKRTKVQTRQLKPSAAQTTCQGGLR